MKLFVVSKISSKKIDLKVKVPTRSAFSRLIKGDHFKVGNELFSVGEVQAEKDINNTTAGALIGGTLGLFGGAPGVFIGGVIGGLVGKDSDDKEERQVAAFNGSRVL